MLKSLVLFNRVIYPSQYHGALRVMSSHLSLVWWRLRLGSVPAFSVSSLSAIGTAAPTLARHETMLEHPRPRPNWKSTVLVMKRILKRISMRTRSFGGCFSLFCLFCLKLFHWLLASNSFDPLGKKIGEPFPLLLVSSLKICCCLSSYPVV